jgi:hypothetical protein
MVVALRQHEIRVTANEGDMRPKPRHLILIIAVGLFGSLFVYVMTSGGSKSQSGDVVTSTISAIEANASASFDITLKEGGDAEHEADHVFEAVKDPAIASASLDVTSLKLEVRYDKASITEADIRRKLVQAGYVALSLADAVPATISADGKSQEHSIKVAQGLDPSVIRAKAGIPLRIQFGQGTNHLVSVSIPELGASADLSTGGGVLDIKDPKPGTYKILCAEGVADGTLLVE